MLQVIKSFLGVCDHMWDCDTSAHWPSFLIAMIEQRADGSFVVPLPWFHSWRAQGFLGIFKSFKGYFYQLLLFAVGFDFFHLEHITGFNALYLILAFNVWSYIFLILGESRSQFYNDIYAQKVFA